MVDNAFDCFFLTEFCSVDDFIHPLWLRVQEQARESYAMREVFSMDSSVRVQAIENLGKWNTEMTKFPEYVLYSGSTRERGKSVVWNPLAFQILSPYGFCFYYFYNKSFFLIIRHSSLGKKFRLHVRILHLKNMCVILYV